MKNFHIISLLVFISTLNAQVGIDTTNPQAQLDIRSSNQITPSNTDGILIPKIDDFPTINPTAQQDGMMVFVTGNGTPTKGFYYWDQSTTSWISFGGASDDIDWLEQGTSNQPDNINDNIYTLGNVTIGQSSSLSVPFYVNATTSNIALRTDIGNATNAGKVGHNIRITDTGSAEKIAFYAQFLGGGNGRRVGFESSITGSTTNSSPYYGAFHRVQSGGFGLRYGSYHTIFGNGSGNQYGNYNTLTGNGTADKFGTYNNVVAGSGDKYGTYNNVRGNNNGTIYGVYNDLNIGGGDKYGSYSIIQSTADGTHYGVYSEVLKISSFAGYFLGNVSIGTTTTNNYILPVSRGTNGQVMQTDGIGNVSWQDVSSGAQRINDLIDGKTNSAGNSTFLGTGSGQNDAQVNGNNTGLGYQSLFTNQTGINNVALGFEAMNLSTQGSFNVAIGFEALRNNDVGASALYHGDFNTAIGGGAGSSNTLGDENVFVGYRSGSANTTGRFNTVVGSHAAFNATTGVNNVYIGEGSARFRNGSNNTQVGTFSGSASTGDNNVLIGYSSGQNGTGNNNVFIGYSSGRSDNSSNRLIIENSTSTSPLIGGDFNLNRVGVNRDISSISNTFEVGGTASKTTAGAWLANSDSRLKKDIQSISGNTALDYLLQLQGVSYYWNDDKTGINRPKHIQYGFVAQNIQKVFPEKVTEDTLGYLQTAYGDYDAFFVEAIKALKVQLDRKDLEIESLKQELKRLNSLEARLEDLESRFNN